MTTETLEVAEPTSDQANGHVEQTEAFDLMPEPKEKLARFGDPRQESIRILRDRLERVLQPVDEDDVWHGVNVVTKKDLDAALALDLPPASIFAASVRTPAYVYVSAVCPICSIVMDIPLVIGVKVTVEGSSRKLELTKEAKAMPHQCGQARLDDLTPSRPEQVAIDDVDEEAEPDEPDPEEVDREAVHALAGVRAPEGASADPDDLSDLPL